MPCDFEAAVDQWLAHEMFDFVGADAARQAIVDAAGCSKIVHPALVGEWLVGEAGDRSGVGTFEIEASPPSVWVAVDGVVMATPATLPSGPHLVQLGNIGTDRPIHAATLDLPPGATVLWAVADQGDQMRVYTCEDLAPWLDDVGAATGADARSLLELVTTLRHCSSFDAEMIVRWSKLALTIGDVLAEPLRIEAVAAVAADDPSAWRRKKRSAALGHIAVPFILGGASLYAYQLQCSFYDDYSCDEGLAYVGSGVVVLGSLLQAETLRPIGSRPIAPVGALGLLSLASGSINRSDEFFGDREVAATSLMLATTAGLVQWVMNEVAWAKFIKRERLRAEQRPAPRR